MQTECPRELSVDREGEYSASNIEISVTRDTPGKPLKKETKKERGAMQGH